MNLFERLALDITCEVRLAKKLVRRAEQSIINQRFPSLDLKLHLFDIGISFITVSLHPEIGLCLVAREALELT